MKLRLEKQSIKLRLSIPEIERLITDNTLEEHIYFSENNKFTYTIIIDEHEKKVSAQFGQQLLTVVVPSGKAKKWLNSNQVGIKETIITDNNGSISLTLEEDLPPRKHRKK